MKRTWSHRLTAAKRRGRFTDHDRELAWGAITCAVGERCNGDMSRYLAAPYSVMMAGVAFTQAVEADKVQDAQDAYDTIVTLMRGRP